MIFLVLKDQSICLSCFMSTQHFKTQSRKVFISEAKLKMRCGMRGSGMRICIFRWEFLLPCRRKSTKHKLHSLTFTFTCGAHGQTFWFALGIIIKESSGFKKRMYEEEEILEAAEIFLVHHQLLALKSCKQPKKQVLICFQPLQQLLTVPNIQFF